MILIMKCTFEGGPRVEKFPKTVYVVCVWNLMQIVIVGMPSYNIAKIHIIWKFMNIVQH